MNEEPTIIEDVEYCSVIPEMDPLAISQAVYSFGFRMKDNLVRAVEMAKFFEIHADAWHIVFEGGYGGFRLTRNGIEAHTRIPVLVTPDNYLEIQGGWDQTRIFTQVSGAGSDDNWASTPETYPPAKVRRWARDETKARYRPPYDTVRKLMGGVSGVLFQLTERIEILNLYQPFWDTPRKIKASPKAEADIQPTLLALMLDAAEQRQLTVERESVHGTGEVDFLFSGTVNGVPERVCVEFKLAHNKKVHHGIQHQLPAYMRQRLTDQGIFVVLWFKGDHFEEPHEYKSVEELMAELQKESFKTRRQHPISVFGIEIQRKASPSKMK